MEHHPVFSQFKGYSGSLGPGVGCDWIGARQRAEWLGLTFDEATEHFEPSMPPLDEEYFGWTDLLGAVVAARDRFVMVELGAGYGRWGVRGALAARQKGLSDQDIEVRFVEAEPKHAAWLRESLVLNGLDGIKSSVIEAAVSKEDGEVFFATGHSGDWYGQCITEVGFDFSPWNLNDVKVVPVRAVSLRSVLADLERVDLIDMDIQGAELDVVSAAVKTLNVKVARMHIETHSHEIDEKLAPVLIAEGWECLYAFPCYGPSKTQYGLVDFEGGQQGWVNPRLGGL